MNVDPVAATQVDAVFPTVSLGYTTLYHTRLPEMEYYGQNWGPEYKTKVNSIWKYRHLKTRKTLEEITRLVTLTWAEKFGAPPNDERLLQVTAKEALEQIHGMYALEELARERAATPQPQGYDSLQDRLTDRIVPG